MKNYFERSVEIILLARQYKLFYNVQTDTETYVLTHHVTQDWHVKLSFSFVR